MTHEIARHGGNNPPRTGGMTSTGGLATIGPSAPMALSLADFDDNTPITIEAGGLTISLTVRDVIEWIAPGAPKPEALKFLIKCRMLRLNPFLDEIYLLPMGSKWGTIVAKSGYLKRADDWPTYDGFEAGVIGQRIINAARGEFGEVQEFTGACLPKGYIVIGGWCRVYRTDRTRPHYISIGTEYYKAASQAWKDNSPTMYRKVAVAQGHREAFAIGDSYDKDEYEGIGPMPGAGEIAARREQRKLQAQQPPWQMEVSQVQTPQIEVPQNRPLPNVDPIIEAEIVETEVIETPTDKTYSSTPPTPEPPAAPTYDWPASASEPIHTDTLVALAKLVVEAELSTEEIAGMLARRGVRTGRLEDLTEMAAQDCLVKLGAELTPFPWEEAAKAEPTKVEPAEPETAEVEAAPIEASPTSGTATATATVPDPAESFTTGTATRREPKPRSLKKSKEAPESHTESLIL